MNKLSTINTAWDMGMDVTYKLLIENLGGYEKAKSKLRDNGSLHAERLKAAILEYRRQHNIFEVGDKVVEITDYPDNDVLTVKSISDNLLVCDSDYLNASYVLSNKHKPCFYVRHATDAEIKAGKRL